MEPSGSAYDAIASALQRITGVPRWICRRVIEACEGDRREALRLSRALHAALPAGIDEVEGGALADAWLAQADTPRNVALREANERALEAITTGQLYWLTIGLIRERRAFCPLCCVVFRNPSWVGPWPERCAACDRALVSVKSVGCIVDDLALLRRRTFNALIEEHIRATINPAFRIDDLREESVSDET